MNLDKLKYTLIKLVVSLSIAVLLFISPLVAHATGEVSDNVVTTTVNSASESTSSKSLHTIDGGLGATRTGYLCYLVNTDGSDYSDSKVITLSSPGCSLYSGTNSIAVTRTGLSAPSGWTGPADWECVPFNIVTSGNTTDVTSNEPKIKAWFQEKYSDGSSKAQVFVMKYWGNNDPNSQVVKDFEDNKCVIVIEVLLNFYYNEHKTTTLSQPTDDMQSTMKKAASDAASSELSTKSDDYLRNVLMVYAEYQRDELNSMDRKQLLKDSINVWANDAYDRAVRQLKKEGKLTTSTTTKIEPALLGTIVNLSDVKPADCNCFDSFLYKRIPSALHIDNAEAGFTTVETGGTLSKSQISGRNGVGMMIISVEGSDQTTCDEKIATTTPVHPAPNESTGTMTIVKNYRSINTDGTYKEEGCKVRTNVSGSITIEDESKYGYTVKKWAITSDPSPAADIDSTKWESEMTNTSKVGAIQKEGTKTGEVELTAPSTTLYLLLERTADIDIQTTYDESQGDTPAPPAKESEGTMQIVKSYRINKGGTYEDKGTYSITNISENILIEDEQSYKVVGWKITTSDSTSVSSVSWETSVPGTVLDNGKTPTTVILDPTKGAKTLYVLLEKQEAESEDYNYKLTQSQITRRVWFSKPDFKLTNMTEQILEHDFQFTKPGHSDSCSGHTVYTVCKGHHDPHEATGERSTGHNDSCSRDKYGNIDCDDSHTESYTYTCTGCAEKTYYNTDYACEKCTDTDYCSGWVWTDTNMNMSIESTLTNADTAVVWSSVSDTYKAHTVKGSTGLTKTWYSGTSNPDVSWTTSDGIHIGTYTNWQSKDTTTNKNWNYIALLVRGKDVVTISDWKNDSTTKNILSEMLSSKGFQIANKPVTSRYTSNAGSNTFYKDQFTASFNKDSNGDYITIRKPTIKVEHPKGNSGICGPESQEAYLASPMTINDITLKVEVYVGQPSLPANTEINTSEQVYSSGIVQNGKASGKMVKSGGTIKFYPYIEMKFDAFSVTNQPVYVMGIYERQITPNDYAELDWNDNGGRLNNLTLNSTQWSTHSQSQSHDAGTVLPGGATLNLTISESNRRTITARTYQTIIMDSGSGRTQINNTGSDGGLTESAAKSAHTNYVNSVTQGIQQLMVNQWVSPNDKASYEDIFGDEEHLVTNNSNINFLKNNSSNASEESKYYFKATSGKSDSGFLDTKVSATNTTYYTFRTDTYGNVYMRTSDSPGDTGSEKQILSQSEGESNLSGVALEINNKTYIVKKILASVERAGGNDSTALTGTQWYNEAIDGITVMVQETAIKVGFITPAERHTVLDPKLIPYNKENNKSSLFTKYFSSAYKTDSYSHKYGESDTDVLGEFKSTKITLKNLQNMFTSSIFYIPNATTQDLR